MSALISLLRCHWAASFGATEDAGTAVFAAAAAPDWVCADTTESIDSTALTTEAAVMASTPVRDTLRMKPSSCSSFIQALAPPARGGAKQITSEQRSEEGFDDLLPALFRLEADDAAGDRAVGANEDRRREYAGPVERG